jgi:hypothetical protein
MYISKNYKILIILSDYAKKDDEPRIDKEYSFEANNLSSFN